MVAKRDRETNKLINTMDVFASLPLLKLSAKPCSATSYTGAAVAPPHPDLA